MVSSRLRTGGGALAHIFDLKGVSSVEHGTRPSTEFRFGKHQHGTQQAVCLGGRWRRNSNQGTSSLEHGTWEADTAPLCKHQQELACDMLGLTYYVTPSLAFTHVSRKCHTLRGNLQRWTTPPKIRHVFNAPSISGPQPWTLKL
eukprot:scaffold9633_cov20-Tisochrysis_lutea.AAC.1